MRLPWVLLSLGFFIVAAAQDSVEVEEETATSENALPSTAYLVIKQSSVPGAGLGVFLSEDSPVVSAGTILTTFGGTDRHVGIITDTEQIYAVAHPEDPEVFRVGEPWTGPVPYRVERDDEVGHLFNDAAGLEVRWPFIGLDGLTDLLRAYDDKSREGANAAVVQTGSWDMEAIRDIQPGEEIFWTYGPAYWLHYASRSRNPLTRLLIYVFTLDREPESLPQDHVAFDRQGRPYIASTKQQVSEQQCRELLRDFFGFKGKAGKAAMSLVGIDPKTTYKQILKALVLAVTHPKPEHASLPESLDVLEDLEEEEGPPERLPTKTTFLEVRQSTIPGAGLGVFVADDSAVVKEGTIITVFGSKEVSAEDAFSPEHAMVIPGKDGVSRVGEPWTGKVPTKVLKEDLAVGHLINDGAAINLGILKRVGRNGAYTFVTMEQLRTVLQYYDVTTMAKVNVDNPTQRMNGNWDMVAARDIQPGEELFVSYGIEFWLGKLVPTLRSPLTRLSVYLATQGMQGLHPHGYIYLDDEARPIFSMTKEEISEDDTKEFVEDYLGFKDKKGKAAFKIIQATPDMTYKEILKRLVMVVVGIGEDEEQGGSAAARK